MLTLGSKLLLYLLAFSLLPLIIGGMISFAVTKKQIEEKTQEHLSDLARDFGGIISFHMSEHYRDIKVLSRADVFKKGDRGAMQNFIAQIAIEGNPCYKRICVIDTKGTIFACTREELIGQSRADRKWFKTTMESSPGEVVVLDAYQTETAGIEISIGFNAPIVDENSGEVLGVLAIRSSIEHIAELMRMFDERSINRKHAYLLNSRGEILAGPNKQDLFKPYRLCDSPEIRELPTDKSGVSLYINDSGEKCIGARYALIGDGNFNGWGWEIIVDQPVSEAYETAYVIRNVIAATLIIMASLIVMSSLIIAKSMSRPIREVAESALRISRGNLESTEISYKGGDEIKDLVDAFNRMGNNLEATTVSRDSLTREIEERKQMETELRESEKRYRSLVENAPLGILTINAQGHILDANPKLLAMFGLTMPERQSAMNIFSLPLLRKAGIARDLQLCLESGKAETRERPLIDKQGKELYFQYHLTPVRDLDNRVTGVQTIVEDSTRRKGLERQLRQSQKMEAIGTLAGGIAHDFNNILMPIIGYTQMSREELPQESPVQENLDAILESANRAKELVKQILAFSRHSEYQLKPLKVQPIVKEALKLLRASVPAHIDIRQNLDNNTGAVLGDSTQIFQVIMNICTNGYQAMKEKGGILEVALSGVHIGKEDQDFSSLNPGPYLLLTVSDTGHGMGREVLERIFEPFFTTKNPADGTGMGLAVAHGIVRGYGGDIKVYSEPGNGTTFKIYLPRIDNPSESPDFSATEPSPTGTEHILLVDDEEAIARMLKRMLKHLGYRVTARTSSVEALAAFREQAQSFDLVLTDVTMPNMSGLELSEELLRIRADIPIVLCTGFSETVSREKAISAGIRDYIMKPFISSQIAATIRHVLDKDRVE